MPRVIVNIWNCGTKNKIDINSRGHINKNAIKAFKRGQCHALALAINKIMGWPIYGICDWSNTPSDPGHICVKNPKNGGYVDIDGYGAVQRWRDRWGDVTLHPLTPAQTYKLDTYLRPSVKKAIPFAKKVLENIGVKV